MPEIKPARPDPVDMDEDEKEMLSEARARLANTKGKKAKRKAREKVLDDARRLAVLQKLRELKAAGVDVEKRKKKKIKGIDYATEIPFERRAPMGFHDTLGEDKALLEAQIAQNQAFRIKKLNEVEDARKSEEEARLRNKDKTTFKRLAASDLPKVLAQEASADIMAVRKRPRLNLPAPVLSLSELEDIGAVAAASDGGLLPGGGEQLLQHTSASMLLEDESGGLGAGDEGDAATFVSNSVAAAAARARGRSGLGLPPTRAAIHEEARNQASLRGAGYVSVLEGGVNVELEAGTGFLGAAPGKNIAAAAGGGGSIVRGSSSAYGSILGGGGGGGGGGGDESSSLYGDSASQFGGRGRGGSSDSKGSVHHSNSAVSLAFATLPAPKNRFHVTAPELPPQPVDPATGMTRDPSWAGTSASLPDSAEARAVREAEKAAERGREELRKSSIFRHPPPPLPRPLILDDELLAPPVGRAANELDISAGMIQDEMLAVLKSDAMQFPVSFFFPLSPLAASSFCLLTTILAHSLSLYLFLRTLR